VFVLCLLLGQSMLSPFRYAYYTVLLLFLTVMSLLTACGGDSDGGQNNDNPPVTQSQPDPDPEQEPPITQQTGQLWYNVGESRLPIVNANYRVIPAAQNTLNAKAVNIKKQAQAEATDDATNHQGQFQFSDGDQVEFTLAGQTFTVAAKDAVLLDDLIAEDQDKKDNLALLLMNVDKDNDSANGIELDEASNAIKALDLALPLDEFFTDLYSALGRYPKPVFSPSLGINLEAPQAEADTVGQAIPFADVFRTARPFRELSGIDVEYDAQGWPTSIPEGMTARTKLFQGTLKDAIPDGDYTVLFEGAGTVYFSGGSLVAQEKVREGHFKLSLNTQNAENDTEANSLNVVIFATNKDDPIRNIRIIMPGGICRDESKQSYEPIDPQNSKDNPFIRVEQSSACPTGTYYASFVSLLQHDRHQIVFNPDYLRHLRDYRVVRMMNFMQASPSYPCENLVDEDYTRCLEQSIAWENRATLQDVVWGGSARTPHHEHKGVPIEVLVALANQLQVDPWFTMPHYADDNWVRNFATYIAQNLHTNLTPHVEYSNETWNPGFWSYYYVQQKGIDENLNTVPNDYANDVNRDGKYFARLRYYTRRSLEVFSIWRDVFSQNGRDPEQVFRVLGTQQGDTVLTKEMLEYQNASTQVDAIAMAPYFFGCINRQNMVCQDTEFVLGEVADVDQIFSIINTPFKPPFEGDPSAIDGTMEKVKRQAEVTKNYNVELVTYEGGQHLTIMGGMGDLPQAEKQRLRALFKQANRDPRMKDNYLTLLNYWRSLYKDYNNVTLFTLYTSAQSYYDFGNWGIKEYLNQPRSTAPKFDAVMSFQESVGKCWWQGCDD